MKEKVISYLKSLGFETVSHESSSRQLFYKDGINVSVEERDKLRI